VEIVEQVLVTLVAHTATLPRPARVHGVGELHERSLAPVQQAASVGYTTGLRERQHLVQTQGGTRGVNRTTLQSPMVLPWRSRRVLTRRWSWLTGSWTDRRSSVLRSTITFTSSMPAKNACRLSKSAVSFGRTTMSTATPGN